MDTQLRMLILSNLTATLDSRMLGIEPLGQARIAFPANAPAVAIADDVLILPAHCLNLIVAMRQLPTTDIFSMG